MSAIECMSAWELYKKKDRTKEEYFLMLERMKSFVMCKNCFKFFEVKKLKLVGVYENYCAHHDSYVDPEKQRKCLYFIPASIIEKFKTQIQEANQIALEKLGLAYSKCKGLLVIQHPGWFEEEECEDCPLYHFCYDDEGDFHGAGEMISIWEPIDFLLKHAEDEE